MTLNKKYLAYSLAFSLLLACGPDPKRVEDAEVSLRVAKQFYSKGDSIQALSNAMKARDQDPKNSEVHNFLGLIHAQRNNFTEAEKSFKQAVKIDPKFSEAQNHLCLVLSQNGKQDEAISHCQKAVENILYATPERAYHNMALAYQRKGNKEKAIESFQKGLNYNKKFVMSLNALGELYISDRKYFDALSPLEQSAAVCNQTPKGIWQNECPSAHYQLAMTYISLQKREKAITSLEDCIKSSESNAELLNKCRSSLKVYK